MSDTYCDRCDCWGHEQDSPECYTYYAEVEKPYHDAKRAQVGEVRGLTDDLDMWPAVSVGALEQESSWLLAGTPVRITAWTPWSPGSRSGDYWTICTLDGKYNATQIYDNELGELGVLDKLALIKEGDEK